MSAARPVSLAARLLRNVMLPLALAWLAATGVALAVAYFFTQTAFDRSLLSDAQLLAAAVHLQDGKLVLGLTPREVNTVLFDQVESLYFAVLRPDGTVVAGQPGLGMPTGAGPVHFGNLSFRGETLRAVALHHEAEPAFDVIVAETRVGRGLLLQRLFYASLVPQLLLLGALAAWLRGAIRNDLRPLAQLQQALGQRGASDLAPVAVQASTRDVQRLSDAINALLARLEGSVRAQREFAGNVAHELRTPLAGIRALAEYGLAQTDPAAWREQLENIATSQRRASRLVDQLLDLALAREAEAGLHREPVDLGDLARDAVMRFLRRADAAGVDLGARGIDAPARVLADATLVEAILDNLLDNALRYGAAPPGEVSAVTVSVEQERGATVLSVQDNGAGLPGEQQAQLMRRGAQGETGQLLGQGAGLGLALVAQYARLMDAQVALGSGPGGRGWLCSIRFQGENGLQPAPCEHQ